VLPSGLPSPFPSFFGAFSTHLVNRRVLTLLNEFLAEAAQDCGELCHDLLLHGYCTTQFVICVLCALGQLKQTQNVMILLPILTVFFLHFLHFIFLLLLEVRIRQAQSAVVADMHHARVSEW
jgi:hypothetical protein